MKGQKTEESRTTASETRPSTSAPMPDMQTSRDTRKIPISKVGVKDISYPIVVMDKNRKFQQTVARVNMYVDSPTTSREPT